MSELFLSDGVYRACFVTKMWRHLINKSNKSSSIYYLIESFVMRELLLCITKQRDERFFDTNNQIICYLPC